MENFEYSEYNSVDRAYTEKCNAMYRYMKHIKPYVISALKSENADVDSIVTIYGNIAKAFGEFNQMRITHMPNIDFKKKFFREQVGIFDELLQVYSEIVPEDNMVLTESEKLLNIG